MTTLTETASDVQGLIDTTVAGYVPTSRTVAGKALSSNVALVASDVGLGNVTNESKATMFTSAALTGTPTAPTAAQGTNTTQIASTAMVHSEAALLAPIASPTFTGTVTLPSGTALVAPALGTPASGTMTNVSGTAASLTAGNASTVPTTNSKTLRLDGNYGIAYAKYSFATDGGTVATKTPGGTVNTTIPANAILVGGTVNVTTACTSSGSGTLAVGCAGTGGSTTTLLAATAVASLTTNALFTTVTTFAAPKKLTGAGSITFTIGTAALTAGIVEVWVQYFTAAA